MYKIDIDLFCRIPWNWKTPTGYLMVVVVQSFCIHCGIFSIIGSLPLFAGFCMLFRAFALDICKNLTDLNMFLDNDNLTPCEQAIEIHKNLAKIIRFHSEAKGWALEWKLIAFAAKKKSYSLLCVWLVFFLISSISSIALF